MFKVIGSATGPFAQVMADLQAIDATKRYTIVEASPDDSGSFTWIQDLHHDLEGALRSCRYLEQKVRASYDPADQSGQKIMASIGRHLQTFEKLKTELVDALFPADS